jgi:hypothetical protein
MFKQFPAAKVYTTVYETINTNLNSVLIIPSSQGLQQYICNDQYYVNSFLIQIHNLQPA